MLPYNPAERNALGLIPQLLLLPRPKALLEPELLMLAPQACPALSWHADDCQTTTVNMHFSHDNDSKHCLGFTLGVLVTYIFAVASMTCHWRQAENVLLSMSQTACSNLEVNVHLNGAYCLLQKRDIPAPIGTSRCQNFQCCSVVSTAAAVCGMHLSCLAAPACVKQLELNRTSPN